MTAAGPEAAVTGETDATRETGVTDDGGSVTDPLQRLEAALQRGEIASEDGEALADQLLAHGAGAAAARWRSWALLPPAAEVLRQGLAEARQVLHGESAEAAPLPPAWRALEQALETGAPPEQLAALARGLGQESARTAGPTAALRLEWSRRLQRAGAPRAALVLLDPLMPEAVADAALAQRLAELQRDCGNAQQAELWSRLSLRLQPRQPLLWFLLARALLDQGELDEALHCAEQGLEQAPGHPWGRKLRLNSLAAAGGWHSVDRLGEAGELPADPAYVSGLEAQRQRRRRRGLAGGEIPPLGLEARLRLRALLRGHSGPVLLLHGRTGEALRWLQRQEVWSALPEVRPVGSRDPLRLAEGLGEAGFPLAPERPLSALTPQEQVALLVIERPAGRRLPRQLAATLEQAPLLLAPRGLLRLPQRRLGEQGGWELFGAVDASP